MATLTKRQNGTMQRGLIRQIERDQEECTRYTFLITLEITEPDAFVEANLKSAIKRALRPQSLTISKEVVTKQRYDELRYAYQDLVEQFEQRVNEKLEEIAENLPSTFGRGVGGEGNIPVEDYYLTASEAAQIAGVSIATAVRYLDSEHWQGTRKARGKNNCVRWLVDPNQSFTRKPRKNEKKK